MILTKYKYIFFQSWYIHKNWPLCFKENNMLCFLTTTAVAAAAAKSLQSCPTLCNPIDGTPPGSPIPMILQPRTLEWVAISFSNAWKWKVKSESEVVQSCPTPSDPMDCSPPGSSVHGIFQARVLEWGAIVFPVSDHSSIKLHIKSTKNEPPYTHTHTHTKPHKKLTKVQLDVLKDFCLINFGLLQST